MLRRIGNKIIFDICGFNNFFRNQFIIYIIMKHTLFFAFFIGILANHSSAQFSAGIKAGGNFTNMIGQNGIGDKLVGHKFNPGFHVGAIGELDVSEFISFQMEAVYSQKGFKLQSNTSFPPVALGSSTMTVTSSTKSIYKFSYVDVPLLLNIHFGQMGSYIGLGPQLSFLAGVKWDGKNTTTTTTVSTGTVSPTTKVDEFTDAGNDKSAFSKIDFGAVIGTGSKFVSGIEYCLRAGYGFSNVINPSASGSNELWHNLVFTVSLGYTFHFGSGGGDRYGHKYNKPKRRH
jgi:Outer membrane protein beta-barrel domain